MFTIHKDFASIILLFAFSIINQVYLIPVEIISQGSSGTFPYLLNEVLVVFTILYLIETLRRKKLKIDKSARISIDSSAVKPVILLIILFLWTETVEYIGFILSSASLLAATAFLYGERSIIKICWLSIIAPFLIFIFFALLKSTLPLGPIEIYLLSTIRSIA
jgi:hypothetical protein